MFYIIYWNLQNLALGFFPKKATQTNFISNSEF